MSPIVNSPPLRPPRRIVSLVPSITESLFSLGLGERVVGVTDWCVHPERAVASLPKVGGTKDADPVRIEQLAPDLVIANHEENTRRVVEALDARGLCVWVTYPKTVREGAELLLEIADLGASDEARDQVARAVLDTVESAEVLRASRDTKPPRVFCPIWRDPWMAPSSDTYIHDMIELCGGENATAVVSAVSGESTRPRRRKSPERYPKLSLEEITILAPEVIWLPDEPYVFTELDARELAGLDVPAARSGRIHLIDGTWVSWYGPRIRQAIQGLGELLTARSC